ncbi:MAG: biopolymer transporter ExbD [Planctomycetota bacterium]|nr:biopolymer transporter ExbD [Planctomycetota bacterium]
MAWRNRLSAGFAEKTAVIDLTPLIDCVFLLIAFFLVAGKFKRPEGKLQAFPPDHRLVTGCGHCFYVRVLAMYDANRKLVWEFNGKRVSTKADLVKKIRGLKAHALSNGYPIVYSRVDVYSDVDFQWVIASIDALSQAGLHYQIAPARIPVSKWPVPLKSFPFN